VSFADEGDSDDNADATTLRHRESREVPNARKHSEQRFFASLGDESVEGSNIFFYTLLPTKQMPDHLVRCVVIGRLVCPSATQTMILLQRLLTEVDAWPSVLGCH
jgi:hypothetical protein